ncbi:MAG TPA: FeoA family protein [Gammaproteobacteria bacterium]|nr:FeoA family protein [Gammaproteobacteria bacterium]
MTLSDLNPGDFVRIDSIETEDPAVQRLMVLGLVEGAELKFLRRSLGGDPLEFRIRGAAISLRRELARRFHVAPVGAHGRAG